MSITRCIASVGLSNKWVWGSLRLPRAWCLGRWKMRTGFTTVIATATTTATTTTTVAIGAATTAIAAAIARPTTITTLLPRPLWAQPLLSLLLPPLHHHHHFTGLCGDGRMPVTRIALSYHHNSKRRGHHPGAQNFWLWSQYHKTLDVATMWLKHVDFGPLVNRSHHKLTIF